ncbi:MAG: hypothetical protein KDJ82_16225 [Rhodobacteraceae bacterium]|nr:hypothetical protein [Paracoccaceae bacterium]
MSAGRARRARFDVAHIQFEITDHPDDGAFFALIAGEATEAKYRRPLFSAPVARGMAAQLRRLADAFEQIEARMEEGQS